jgi:2-methylisocitrate lyase-like PEP mutase family enzyme
VSERRDRFRAAHERGCLVLPNAWDVGSAKLLVAAGAQAIATTSSGHAATLGRTDQHVTRDELVSHVEALAAAVDVPLHVDAEACFPGQAGGIEATVRLLADAGAASFSIEDHDGGLLPIDAATDRVATAVAAARDHDLLVTARAENHLYGVDDLDDTMARLVAYRDVGADVVFAPGLDDVEVIERVVLAVEIPLNVLLVPGGPSVRELADVGVRRVSTGGALAFVAYGAAVDATGSLLRGAGPEVLTGAVPAAIRERVFGG